MRPRFLILALAGALLSGATPALAWPETLMLALGRDARRLVPRSLARLLGEREPEILEQMRRFPVPLAERLAKDLSSGRLSPETLAQVSAREAEVVSLIREHRVSEGLVRLGALLRIPADLSDPVLSAGPAGYPPGVVREYYAFVEANLPKIPVVLDDQPALTLDRRGLPRYWEGVLSRSRAQSDVIRTELYKDGRVVDHRRIDHRNPVFGVASLSYSRGVTAIAATWLAVWREVRGDLTRMPVPRMVLPGYYTPEPTPTPELPLPEVARP